MDEGLHAEAATLLIRHHDGAFSLIQGELSALLALSLIKRRSLDCYAKAVALLEAWQDRREEQELWQRLMSIRATALVNLGEFAGASRLAARLAAGLEAQSRHDPMAQERLQALNRKADMYLPFEVSHVRIKRALAWFGPAEEGGVPRNGFEYGACLLNLSGSLYTVGRFDDAATHAAMAMETARSLCQQGYRSIDPAAALNNFAIASFRANARSAGDLATALRPFVPDRLERHPGDATLFTCNWAALAMLAGQAEEPRDMLRWLWRQVFDIDGDAYYSFCVGANLAVVEAVLGANAEALGVLDRIEPAIDTMPNWFVKSHQRRHAMM